MILTWEQAPEANPDVHFPPPQIYTHGIIIGPDKGSRTFYLCHILAPSSPLPPGIANWQRVFRLSWASAGIYLMPMDPPGLHLHPPIMGVSQKDHCTPAICPKWQAAMLPSSQLGLRGVGLCRAVEVLTGGCGRRGSSHSGTLSPGPNSHTRLEVSSNVTCAIILQ